MEFKVVIGDPKTGKSYQKSVPEKDLTGKKIGEKIEGKILGLDNYELEITGGSDDCGFPMRKDIDGILRKKILAVEGIGIKTNDKKGRKIRKTVRGNTISTKTVQINMKVLKQGIKPLEELLGKKEEKSEEK